MLDPWLVSSNFTNYLIDQFNDVQGNCSTTLPYTTSSSTLYIATVTPTSTITAPNSTTILTTTCTGQPITPMATPLICNDLSDA